MVIENHLDEEQVRALLSYEELIPAIRQALMDFSAGRVQQPVRTIMPVSSHGGWFGSCLPFTATVMGAKMVTFYPGNAELQKHTHMAMIQLFRSDTGEPWQPWTGD
jgi:ornithine cyclodeaminase/alanine dehydrogenase-like protein (mu-crystallin family)